MKYARNLKNLGKNVQKQRKLRGITQEELAAEIGVSSTYIGFIEQSKRQPAIDTLDKIARALKVKLSELLD